MEHFRRNTLFGVVLLAYLHVAIGMYFQSFSALLIYDIKYGVMRHCKVIFNIICLSDVFSYIFQEKESAKSKNKSKI